MTGMPNSSLATFSIISCPTNRVLCTRLQVHR
jgi:hypothetical protein